MCPTALSRKEKKLSNVHIVHWSKIFEIHLIEPTNAFGLKTLSGKELEPVVSLLLSLDRHTITISWGKLFLRQTTSHHSYMTAHPLWWHRGPLHT